MAVLVTGGAGYIGSHTVIHLLERGEEVVVLDHLGTGHPAAVKATTFYQGDLRDEKLIHQIFQERPIESVVHFAALSLVGTSSEDPLSYYDNNVSGTRSLLSAMVAYGVKRMVFSSTAAVYGEPETIPIPETAPLQPTNPYGETKRVIEGMLAWCDQAYGIRSTSLRYFNAAGAHPTVDVGEDHDPETHLIPILLQVALGQRDSIQVFGVDYPTPDGTCIRDYVHVMDLAEAHGLALDRLRKGGSSAVYNLGNGKGFSVREVIQAVEGVIGRRLQVQTAPRRPGDPAVLVASAEKARAELGWNPRYPELDEIVASAWKWAQRHPRGYEDGPN
ncbi:UDP-glucose 4-epimerase [Kroppenstedtia sanguinis]|uniref:UDP-glucose 4-epimerase GalE n=1 Tax=Kroppenstedtia sanguinis TaxID=1380684 RepID=UPI003D1E4D5A